MRFSAGMRHRGPDDEGFVLFRSDGLAVVCGGNDTDPAAGLVHISEVYGDFTAAFIHRRLSIVGLGVAGHQPFTSGDAGWWLTYNGEIFNYRELDRQYGFENHSGTDTETLHRLWTLKQDQSIGDLDGFFAFAAYHPKQQILQLRRDPTGVKPFYVADADGLFYFCSDAAVLAGVAGLNNPDAQAVWHMLSDGVFIPGIELYAGVEPVQDGLDVKLPSLDRTQVFHAEPEGRPGGGLRATLEQSVRRRLMSDVPLGFAVSGGLDSAAVIGLARQQLGADVPLKLFSVTSTDPGSDESAWQREVAEFNGAEWHHVNIEDAGPHLLEEVVNRTGLPPVAWNNLAHFELCRLTKSHGVTVLFNGQGADEIFGGYPDYLARLPQLWMKNLTGNAAHWPLEAGALAKMWLALRVQGVVPGLASLIKSDPYSQLLKREFRGGVPFAWQLSHMGPDRKMAADYYGQRLNQMLMWEDRNGMAHSLESRNPFADDRELARWLNVPLAEKCANGYAKGVLREALEGVMPESVRWRVDKKGFTVPDTALTWKNRTSWEPLFMGSLLDEWSPRQQREKFLRSLKPDPDMMRWYFRLSSFSAFLQHLKS